MFDARQAVALEALRRYEVERVQRWFKPGMTVLEIGGADGLQAGVIASWGCRVRSVDLPGRPAGPKAHYPVQDYDGSRLPFPDAAFDVVFSSNVLEHIKDVERMLAECCRVLNPGGVCIHILPSTAWRCWTLVTHYPAVLLALLGRESGEAPVPTSKGVLSPDGERCSLARRLRGTLIPPPHGEDRSAFVELYTYSSGRWRRLFERCGFQVIHMEPARLFYTGHVLLPALTIGSRVALASLCGSGCRIYVLKVRPPGVEAEAFSS